MELDVVIVLSVIRSQCIQVSAFRSKKSQILRKFLAMQAVLAPVEKVFSYMRNIVVSPVYSPKLCVFKNKVVL